MSVHNKYTGYTLKHLLLRHMYNLLLPNLCAIAQALHSETSYYDACALAGSVLANALHTVLCGIFYSYFCRC